MKRRCRRPAVVHAEIGREIDARVRKAEPVRRGDFSAPSSLDAGTDPGLLRIMLDNLPGNAWKYSGRRADARIGLGQTKQDGRQAFFARDNGAGLDMQSSTASFRALPAPPLPGRDGAGRVRRPISHCW